MIQPDLQAPTLKPGTWVSDGQRVWTVYAEPRISPFWPEERWGVKRVYCVARDGKIPWTEYHLPEDLTVLDPAPERRIWIKDQQVRAQHLASLGNGRHAFFIPLTQRVRYLRAASEPVQIALAL